MALTSTMYTLAITLSDVDRGVYELLTLRVPMHPSESPAYFVTRVLAYCLSYREGITFSRGISDPDEPTLAARDLTGALTLWVEIGAPDAERMHKAAKAAPEVAVYTHRDPAMLHRQYTGARIHRAEHIPLYVLDRALVDALAERLDRRMEFSLAVTDGMLYCDVAGDTLSGTIQRLPLVPSV